MNLQGGTGIAQPTTQLYTQPINVQPGTSTDQYPATYSNQTPDLNTGNTTSAPAPVTDPYAAWGGKAAYDALVADYNTQDQTIHNSSNDAATSSALGLHGSILDYLYQTQKSQNAINEQGVQNELARKQGTNSILDMVNQGVNSGGVMLANKNAGSSSASEAIARAYAKIGQRENTKIGQQYDAGNRAIDIAQTDLGAQRALGKGKIDIGKQQAVAGIVNDAQNKLAALDASMAGANLTQRINIEAEKQQIHDSVMGILSQYDAELAQGDAGINPTSVDTRRAEAFKLANSGAGATNPFDFTSSVPAQFQNTGPFTSALPLFTAPSKKNQG